MYQTHRKWIPWAVLLLLGVPGTLAARTCDIDAVPAATLLIPYFEVDPAALVPPYPGAGYTTVFALINTTTVPRLAHVTLWTDWAIPTVGFDVYLSSRDEQSINVQDIFTGDPPATARPSNCDPDIGPGLLNFNPAFATGTPATDLENLRLAHTGATLPLSSGPKVAGSLHADRVTGYITVDVVRQCTALFPSDPGTSYFKDNGAGIATNDNVLVGDVFFIDFNQGLSAGDTAVHIRADASFGANDYTFYGRYVKASGRDERQPLANAYATRQLNRGTVLPANTDLLIWRDTKSPVITLPAPGGKPHWAPLGLNAIQNCDEDASCNSIAGTAALATQRVKVGPGGGIPLAAPFGWLQINLNHRKIVPGSRTSLFGGSAQGFVATFFGASFPGGNGTVGLRAFRLPAQESYCKP